MPSEPQPPTLSGIARRAVEICDPAGEHPLVADLLARFEDRDEPITGLEDVQATVSEERMRVDPEGDDPAVTMTAATIVYLAHRRDEIGGDREDVLRLVARAELHGEPPPAVAGWLAAEGVEV